MIFPDLSGGGVMITRYSQVMHSQVVTLDEQQSLGSVTDIVLNKTDFTIKAFLIRTMPVIPMHKVISFSDVVEIASNAVLVQNEDAVSDMKDSVRVKEAIKAKIHGIGQRVYTKSKKFIGVVYDYTIHSETGKIIKIYVKTLLSDRIIGTETILKFEGKKIIIEDEFETITNKSSELETA